MGSILSYIYKVLVNCERLATYSDSSALVSIYLTRLSAEKLRSAVKAREEGGKNNFLSFHIIICDRAAADKQVEKTDQNPTLRS